MNPKSDSLFHLTPKLDFLIDAFTAGLWPRYCLEDIEWLGFNDKCAAFPMVCFCEIPFNRMGVHIKKYGSYGMGVKRKWAESRGINPVRYVVPDSNVAEIFKEMNVGGCKDQLRKLAAFCKPVRGKMPGFSSEVDFYQESEWRYVPRDGLVYYSMQESHYNDPAILKEANERSKNFCSLLVPPEFIDFILVPDEANIPMVYAELEKYYGTSPTFSILISKITPMDRLMNNV